MKWLALRRRSSESELDPRLAAMEPVFHAPPLTPELLAAVKLISSRLKLRLDEASRVAWEKEQNGTCWSEYEALRPLLSELPRPSKVLEIGPGLGRSVVFFSQKCAWRESQFHLYDADGSSTKYKQKYFAADKKSLQDSFCGNLAMLRFVLDYNQIANYRIFDARQTALSALPGPYDLIYSFYSIGFHWSLEAFLDDLLPLMHDNTVSIFTVKADFQGFPRLRDFHCRVLEWKTVRRKKSSKLGMLVMSKGVVPNIGIPLAY